MSTEGLNSEQVDLLEQLVNIPSYYNDKEGQRPCDENTAMQMIETHFDKYLKKERDGRMIGVLDGLWTHNTEGGRKNVFVRKGTGTEFVLWLTGHVDTVRIDGAGGKNMKFDKQGDTMTGPGVGDMKEGIMGMMDVLCREPVPSNMTVIGAFLADEEINSKGADLLVELQSRDPVSYPVPDLIFSPEIPTLVYPVRPDVVPITVARRGHLKYYGDIAVPKGHGAQGGDAANAIYEYADLLAHLTASLTQYRERLPAELFYGAEEMSPSRVVSCEDESLSVTDKISYRFRRMITMLSNKQAAIDHIKEKWEEFEVVQHHISRKIHGTLLLSNKDRSYSPYAMPIPGKDPNEDTLHAQNLARVVNRVYGRDGRHAQFTAGRSTSDANVFAEQGWKIYECTGDAGGEHGLNEWASSKGAARTIQIMEELVSGRFLEEKIEA